MKNLLPKQGIFTILSLLFLLIAIVGCGPANGVETPQSASPTASPTTSSDASPDAAYPAAPLPAQPQPAYPDPAVEAGKPLLALNKPARVGDRTVTGVGPPGLAVELINITFMGERLGAGVIDQDGTFSISVDPLPGGIRMGLSADISPLGLEPEDFQLTEGTISVPQVGHFFDSAVTASD
jgi:hypothetical protein